MASLLPLAAGNYLIEVRSVDTPEEVYVKAPFATTVGVFGGISCSIYFRAAFFLTPATLHATEAPPRKRSAMEVLFADYSRALEF